MKIQRMILLSLALIISLAALGMTAGAQAARSGKLYQEMTVEERHAFVAEQARAIARQMSGTEYDFTAAFE
ncbi:MAG TPA: hypothetical protein VJT09_00670, partial [Pyrinomonadaceae bacterium]|nr:hypothetical protein [Pyrinomonadaceae bacterium]